jgi:hypothetical protein
MWLIDNGSAEFGTDWLAIAGEARRTNIAKSGDRHSPT